MAGKIFVGVRLEPELVSHLDKIRAEKQALEPGRNITRTEIVSGLIEESAEAASTITLNTKRPESDKEPKRTEKRKK